MTPHSPNGIVGRGVTAGASLFRDWFDRLTAAGHANHPTAYVFVMGSLAELLRVFDFELSFPEINSLQTAVRRVAHEYLNEAEDYGYSPDICGYVKADVAVQLRKGAHPMGTLPPPSLAVATNACNTYVKWAEIWERLYHIPVFTLDVPGTRRAGGQTWPGNPDFSADCAYVAAQLQELIALCEHVTDKHFDIDRLREVLGHANAMTAAWRRVIALNRHEPAVFGALTDGTVYLGVANGLRGTPEGRRYFDDLVEEMEHKAAHGLGTIDAEKHRLVFVGVPCYPIFRRFNEMFSEWGGVFVNSTYLWFASGGADLGFEYDLSRPLESLAEGVLISVRHAMDSMFHQDRAIAEILEPFHVDGVVYHPIKSCRTVSTGLADSRRALMARTDIPSLFIESDMMDKRVVSEAQLKNRIDAFFEGLDSRNARRV
ncbi:MAG: 2-hydroxyacyl-CoA dehydratase family protein [Acidobacteriia bacterium]|nr:2-hydroxyacyl-CoA dehydratase family protein [Terriglobia bacterium]